MVSIASRQPYEDEGGRREVYSQHLAGLYQCYSYLKEQENADAVNQELRAYVDDDLEYDQCMDISKRFVALVHQCSNSK